VNALNAAAPTTSEVEGRRDWLELLGGGLADPDGVNPPKTQPRKRIIIKDGETPEGALVWSDPATKARALHNWRRGIMRRWSGQARALRIAWALEWKFANEGYAFPSDQHLAQETGLPLNKAQQALTDLERGRAIIRVHLRASNGNLARRIYPALAVAELAPPKLGGINAPQGGTKSPPRLGGYNTYGKARRGLSSTAQAALLDANRREAASAPRSGPPRLSLRSPSAGAPDSVDARSSGSAEQPASDDEVSREAAEPRP
jgi:hypothetical protein